VSGINNKGMCKTGKQPHIQENITILIYKTQHKIKKQNKLNNKRLDNITFKDNTASQNNITFQDNTASQDNITFKDKTATQNGYVIL
jgi:hypothetical protein